MIVREPPRIAEGSPTQHTHVTQKMRRARVRSNAEPDERQVQPRHYCAALKIFIEPRAVQPDGKPRKTEPKLLPADVLKRAGLTREEIAARVWRDR